MKINLLIILSLIFVAGSTQTYYSSVPNTAAGFLRVPADIRFAGMGNTGIATSGNEYSPLLNNAKIMFEQNSSALTASYTPWLSDFGAKNAFVSNLSFYKQMSDKNAFSAAFRYFSLGSIQYADNSGNALNTYTPNELALELGYAMKLNEFAGLGLTLKYIRSSLANGTIGGTTYSAGNAVAGDISFIYNNVGSDNEGFSYGATLTNLGSKLSYSNSDGGKSFIPANVGIGISYQSPVSDNSYFTVAADINKMLVPAAPASTNNYKQDSMAMIDYSQKGVLSSWVSSFADGSNQLTDLRVGLGVEFNYDQTFFARTGYFFEDKTNGNNKYFTVGMGFKYKKTWGFDFAYIVPTGDGTGRSPLSNTLRLGLNVNFGKDLSNENNTIKY